MINRTRKALRVDEDRNLAYDEVVGGHASKRAQWAMASALGDFVRSTKRI